MHAIAFLLIIAMDVLASLTMALAGRGDPSWRPIHRGRSPALYCLLGGST